MIYKIILRLSFIAIICYAVLSFGSVDTLQQSLISLGLGALLVLSFWLGLPSPELERLYFLAAVCLAGFVGYTLLQSIRNSGWSLEDPVWDLVRREIAPIGGAISATPEMTRVSIVSWAPLLGFLVALRLFAGQRPALHLLNALCLANFVFALFGLYQAIADPRGLIGIVKIAYLGSLTATFVNRNTAGTFFGCGVLISMAFCAFHLRNLDARRLTRFGTWRYSHNLADYRRFYAYALLGVVQITALGFTQSRGAMLATLGGMAVFWLVLSRYRLTAASLHVSRRHVPRLLRGLMRPNLVRFAVVFGFLALVTLEISAQSLLRLKADGSDEDRFCTYGATLRAIADFWPFGSGFGAFQDVFAGYRDAGCSGVAGVWDIGHNSYLEGTLGLGAILPCLMIVAMSALIVTFVSGIRRRRRLRAMPTLGLAALTLVALHATLDFSMQIPGAALFVAALLAATANLALMPEADDITPAAPSPTAPAPRFRR